MRIFDTVMDVYVPDSVGRFTVKRFAAVPCRLTHVSGGDTAFARAELAAMRHLLFSPATTLPDTCQIEVSGVRWNPQPYSYATFGRVKAMYKTAELIRGG